MEMNGCTAGKSCVSKSRTLFGSVTHSLSDILFSGIVRNNNGSQTTMGKPPKMRHAKNLMRLRVLLIMPYQSPPFRCAPSLWPVVNIDDSGAALGLRPLIRLPLIDSRRLWHCFLWFKMTLRRWFMAAWADSYVCMYVSKSCLAIIKWHDHESGQTGGHCQRNPSDISPSWPSVSGNRRH